MSTSVLGTRQICWHCRLKCDQMAKLVFQYLAIHNNNENLPKSIQIVPKWVHNFDKYQKPLNKWAKVSQFVAQAAKFRKIWSHCLRARFRWELKTQKFGGSNLQLRVRM